MIFFIMLKLNEKANFNISQIFVLDIASWIIYSTLNHYYDL